MDMVCVFSYCTIATAAGQQPIIHIMDNKYSAGQMIFANIIYASIFNVEIHKHTHTV